jgi:hypothetical protein
LPAVIDHVAVAAGDRLTTCLHRHGICIPQLHNVRPPRGQSPFYEFMPTVLPVDLLFERPLQSHHQASSVVPLPPSDCMNDSMGMYLCMCRYRVAEESQPKEMEIPSIHVPGMSPARSASSLVRDAQTSKTLSRSRERLSRRSLFSSLVDFPQLFSARRLCDRF